MMAHLPKECHTVEPNYDKTRNNFPFVDQMLYTKYDLYCLIGRHWTRIPE